MQDWTQTTVHWLLAALALPEIGLSAIFVASLVSATLLPLGSEPAVFGYARLYPGMFWPAVLTATVGNTLGGAISYWTGRAAHRAMQGIQQRHAAQRGAHPEHPPGRLHALAHRWAHRLGPKALLLSWLPLVGDPLCAVAGWLRLDFLQCTLYMALGKFARYVCMTAALLWLFPHAS